MTENKTLGLGLIGCGGFGRFCMQAFAELPDVHPAAVADVVAPAAQSLGKELDVPAFTDPQQLIECEDVDIVHIATPPSSHYPLVLAAARAGKHTLCEKPLAINTRQAEEILAAAAKAGVIVPVNFVLRYNAVTEAVKAVISSGALGRVLAARLTNCASDAKLAAEHWFWDKDVSGGIFIEHGVHFFDLYSYWLGPGRVIDAHAKTREGTSQEDRVMCTIAHEAGAVSSHYHGFDQIFPMDRADHRLVCELGDIRVAGWIPLSLTVDAAVDDQSQQKLTECLPGAKIKCLESFDGKFLGRGISRHVGRRIHMQYEPDPDKQAVYAESVRALLADQIAFVRDRSHQRRITEKNGLASVAMAEAAAKLAATNG